MQNVFKTELIRKSKINFSRVTEITTPHGVVITPTFMPVGTRAFVNHLTPQDLTLTNSQIILGGNTYHMLVAPGLEIIEAAGGMHKFMGWNKPMLTDSGGFQVFSLSKGDIRIDTEGAHFKHPIFGNIIHLTPKSSIEAQKKVGADIIMAFDECTPENGGRQAALTALERTHRWLIQSKEIHDQVPYSSYGHRQALFGIIQGGRFRDLREKSAEHIVQLDLDGIAIGGEIIGFDMVKTIEVIDWVRPLLPETKIRYTMGVGLSPQNLIEVIAKGVDIFDCVAPTRNARHGSLYHGRFVLEHGWGKFVSEYKNGRIQIKKTKYAKDEAPILEDCSCYTCKNFSRAYLHYLIKQKSKLYDQLACIHNIYIMQETCRFLHPLIK